MTESGMQERLDNLQEEVTFLEEEKAHLESENIQLRDELNRLQDRQGIIEEIISQLDPPAHSPMYNSLTDLLCK